MVVGRIKDAGLDELVLGEGFLESLGGDVDQGESQEDNYGLEDSPSYALVDRHSSSTGRRIHCMAPQYRRYAARCRLIHPSDPKSFKGDCGSYPPECVEGEFSEIHLHDAV